jgi:adenine-specific DNA-methyltransferase
MVNNTLEIAKILLSPKNGVICCSIDDFEHRYFSQVIEMHFGELAGTVAIRIKPSGRPIPNGFAISHEYAVFAKTNQSFPIARLEHNEEQKARYRETDENGKFFWEMFRKAGSNSNRENRPTMYYPFFLNIQTGTLRLPQMEFDSNKQKYLVKEPLSEAETEIYPIKDDGSDGCWYFGLERAQLIANEFKAVMQDNNEYRVYYRRRPNEGIQPTTLWFDSKYSATEHGTALLKAIFGKQEIFSYPKSIHAVADCLSVSGISNITNCIILDYFAGSGTTGHAVINQNRLDDGKRKYILVEMGEHFDTVLKPRIQKVIYSKDWNNGKPVSREGSSHLFKYIRLESYEDALNNLHLKRTPEQGSLLDQHDKLREQYMLSYMLDVESAGSASLLNVSAFADPFNYRMYIARGNETKETVVDLVETFNWLLGIKVLRISQKDYRTAEFDSDAEGRLQIAGRPRTCAADEGWTFQDVEGETLAGDKVLIIWRTLTENPEKDNVMLDSWFSKRNYNTLDFEFSRIYVNGDNNLENLKIGEERWKVAMIEEEFKRLMFDVEGV